MFKHITKKEVITFKTRYGYKCTAYIFDGLSKRKEEVTYNEKVKKAAAVDLFVRDTNKLVDRLEARYNERRATA